MNFAFPAQLKASFVCFSSGITEVCTGRIINILKYCHKKTLGYLEVFLGQFELFLIGVGGSHLDLTVDPDI